MSSILTNKIMQSLSPLTDFCVNATLVQVLFFINYSFFQMIKMWMKGMILRIE